MTIDRRNFLRLSAFTGLAITAPNVMRPKRARAADPYPGPYYINIHASGGWDPTYFCDPKTDPEIARAYQGIGTAGIFSYAPTSVADLAAIGLDAAQPTQANYVMSNQAFFEKYANQLRVINGVDTATNNHDIGTRLVGSGFAAEGYPAFTALAASVLGGKKALAYIASGGYAATRGLVPTTRLSSQNFARMAYPFDYDPAAPGTAPYHTTATAQRIRAAQQARNAALRERQSLPRSKLALSELAAARIEEGELAALQIPTLVDLPGNQLGDSERLIQQMQLVLASFQAGLGVTATLSLGGFDTHANHDRDQVRQLAKLLYSIDWLWTQAQQMGLDSKLTIIVTGDFGRGPMFNGTNNNSGKDHWPVTSVLLLGRGINVGLVGSTDAYAKPNTVNAQTLQPDASGVRIKPVHIHQALRKHANIAGNVVTNQFAFADAELAVL